MARVVKIAFRFKKGSKGAVKVYTNVRVGFHHPAQVHLGYVPSGGELADHHFARIEKKLQTGWPHHADGELAIDRDDARKKWAALGKPKAAGPEIDREQARQQISRWTNRDYKSTSAAFGGKPCEDDPEHDAFQRFFYKSSELIARQSESIDLGAVTKWWIHEETPRLLFRYHQFTLRNPSKKFGPAGFIYYLLHNINNGYAARSFLRAHRKSEE